MNYYVLLDGDGIPKGYYNDEFGPTPPDGSIKITEEEREALIHDSATGLEVPIGTRRYINGKVAIHVEEIPLADSIKALQTGVQNWLDATVQANGYDSIVSCASYSASVNATFKAEATAAIAWRDAVWSACYAQFNAMTDSTALPTIDVLIASLPQSAAYGWVARAMS